MSKVYFCAHFKWNLKMSKKWLSIIVRCFSKNVICRHATNFDQMVHSLVNYMQSPCRGKFLFNLQIPIASIVAFWSMTRVLVISIKCWPIQFIDMKGLFEALLCQGTHTNTHTDTHTYLHLHKHTHQSWRRLTLKVKIRLPVERQPTDEFNERCCNKWNNEEANETKQLSKN